MAIKTIFWDIGGVLERTEDHNPRAALADRLGWTVPDLSRLIFGHTDHFRIQLGEIGPEEHYANIAEALDITPCGVDQVFAEFFAGDQLDRALVEYIRSLKQDYTTAVISNYTVILREKIENQWQIGDAFDELIISSEVGMMKPAPGIFYIALEKTSTVPEEAVLIDDFIQNVEGAHNVGMQAILFETPAQAMNDLNALINDLTGHN
ncbi:MAG: HAD-IA family hydrolase [Anaerolineales bacterium]|nr:HAD-IA family hydrolase [Anaerolineales bacterium]